MGPLGQFSLRLLRLLVTLCGPRRTWSWSCRIKVSHYHTPSRELMDHTLTHTLLFILLFRVKYGDNLCIVDVAFFSVSCLPPGPALQMIDVIFPSLFTFGFASCR